MIRLENFVSEDVAKLLVQDLELVWIVSALIILYDLYKMCSWQEKIDTSVPLQKPLLECHKEQALLNTGALPVPSDVLKRMTKEKYDRVSSKFNPRLTTLLDQTKLECIAIEIDS